MRCFITTRSAPHENSVGNRLLWCRHNWYLDYSPPNAGMFSEKIERYCIHCGTRQVERLIDFDPPTGYSKGRKWVNR